VITSGNIGSLVIVIVAWILTLYLIRLSRKSLIPLRRLPALDAVEEMVGRCAEMGKPLLGVGIEGLTGHNIAAMSIAAYTAGLCAKMKVRMVNVIANEQALPLAKDVFRSEYVAAGKADLFDPEDQVRFYGSRPLMKYQSAVGMVVDQLQPAGVLMAGPWGGGPSQSLVVSEVVARSGALSIGGGLNLQTIMAMALSCTYTLIGGEELYAVGAYVSKDPAMTGTVVTQDVFRLIFAVLILIGTFLSIAGNKFLVDLLKW
jgi:hypothetical protein